MKNIIFALVLLVLCISCTEEATQPANNDTKTYEKWFYDYNEASGTWFDQPSSINIVKSTPSKSPRKYYCYAECYGKNWMSKLPEEKNGLVKEIVLKDSYPVRKLNFRYDSKNYINEEYETKGSQILWRDVYTNKNGKLESLTKFNSDGVAALVCVYEYDALGYISKIYSYNEKNELIQIDALQRDISGFLIYCMSVGSEGEITNETTYTYNDNGLISMESTTEANTYYSYDGNKRLVQVDKENEAVYSYAYYADGSIREIITEEYSGKKYKTVYKY